VKTVLGFFYLNNKKSEINGFILIVFLIQFLSQLLGIPKERDKAT
jgi:hypothetical protein